MKDEGCDGCGFGRKSLLVKFGARVEHEDLDTSLQTTRQLQRYIRIATPCVETRTDLFNWSANQRYRFRIRWHLVCVKIAKIAAIQIQHFRNHVRSSQHATTTNGPISSRPVETGRPRHRGVWLGGVNLS